MKRNNKGLIMIVRHAKKRLCHHYWVSVFWYLILLFVSLHNIFWIIKLLLYIYFSFFFSFFLFTIIVVNFYYLIIIFSLVAFYFNNEITKWVLERRLFSLFTTQCTAISRRWPGLCARAWKNQEYLPSSTRLLKQINFFFQNLYRWWYIIKVLKPPIIFLQQAKSTKSKLK